MILDKIKKELKNRFNSLEIFYGDPEEKRSIFFDIGYGERVVLFFLPLDTNSKKELLIYRMPLEVLFESIRRFIEVKPPVGYRIRFFISYDDKDKYHPLLDHVEKFGKNKFLLVVNLEEAGLGNEKLIINNLPEEFLLKIDRVLKENLFVIKKSRLKEWALADYLQMKVVEFRSLPNKFKNSVNADFYDGKRRDFIVMIIFAILKRVLK